MRWHSVVDASRDLQLVAAVGLPLAVDHLLFNVAAIVSRGQILGLVPKSYLPNYREYYEARQFQRGRGRDPRPRSTSLGQKDMPFGSRVLFQLEEQPLLTIHVEICEDVWVPIPPSSYAALAGATVLLNLSASPFTIGKAGYRRDLVSQASRRAAWRPTCTRRPAPANPPPIWPGTATR